jgi:tRNA(Ile)-lysidine synthase
MTPLAEIDSNQVIEWDLNKPLYLAESRLTLQVHVSQGEGLDASLCQQERVTIRFRQGGEACQPVGRKEHHTLKQLFQEHGIPPWERQRIPLIYIGGKLAQVGNYWICEPFQVSVDESGYIISLVKE